jgi:hypothetical protein
MNKDHIKRLSRLILEFAAIRRLDTTTGFLSQAGANNAGWIELVFGSFSGRCAIRSPEAG